MFRSVPELDVMGTGCWLWAVLHDSLRLLYVLCGFRCAIPQYCSSADTFVVPQEDAVLLMSLMI